MYGVDLTIINNYNDAHLFIEQVAVGEDTAGSACYVFCNVVLLFTHTHTHTF